MNLQSHQDAEQDLFLDSYQERGAGQGYVRVTEYWNREETYMDADGVCRKTPFWKRRKYEEFNPPPPQDEPVITMNPYNMTVSWDYGQGNNMVYYSVSNES